MGKIFRHLTDRRWIPVASTSKQGARWIFYLLSFVFVIFFILFLLGLALAQEAPQEWNIVDVIRTDDGLWGIFLQNPKDETEIIVIILKPVRIFLIKQDKPPEVHL